MYIDNAATPLAICHDVGIATHGAHGVQRNLTSAMNWKSLTNWPDGRFESGDFNSGFKAVPVATPGA
jgi:hypothetical protein